MAYVLLKLSDAITRDERGNWLGYKLFKLALWLDPEVHNKHPRKW